MHRRSCRWRSTPIASGSAGRNSASACARVNPRVRATITGDGRELFEAEFGWDGEPRVLDLDVSGIRDLVIQIDPTSAETIGACEHLVFAEARVIK